MEMLEWAKWFENYDYKVVIKTEVDEYTISTVWLGLDHNHFGGIPLIFETMVFRESDNWEDNAWDHIQERYSTEEQAREGHNEIVKRVRDANDD